MFCLDIYYIIRDTQHYNYTHIKFTVIIAPWLLNRHYRILGCLITRVIMRVSLAGISLSGVTTGSERYLHLSETQNFTGFKLWRFKVNRLNAFFYDISCAEYSDNTINIKYWHCIGEYF